MHKTKYHMKISKPITMILIVITTLFFLQSCSNDDDDLNANISLTEGVDGNIGGDFTGNGGNTTETFIWQNNLLTADYNADITASTTGLFQMIVKDSEGTTVLDRTLNGNVEPDSFSGVTTSGEVGMWTVTIIVSDFNGDVSFTLTEGD